MDRTRKIGPRGKVQRRDERPDHERIEPILDREFSYYREGMRWSFQEGRILLDGYDVNQLVSDPDTTIATHLGIAGGLDDYRKSILKQAREGNQFSRFAATAEALIGKVMGRLKRIYDQKQSGISWALENGQLILNGINVRSFLALYRVKKSEKAKKFLEGLQKKLIVLLDNPAHENIRNLVQELFDEIKNEISPSKTARPISNLPPDGGSPR